MGRASISVVQGDGVVMVNSFWVGGSCGRNVNFHICTYIYICARRNLNDDSSLGARTLAKMSFNQGKANVRKPR